MIRLLLTVFGTALVVCVVCWIGVLAMGGPGDVRGIGPFGRQFGPDGRWSYGWHGDDNDDSEAPGPVTTREIPWEGGDKLVFEVPAVIHYTQGPVVKITATGPENWVNKLQMDGNALTVTSHVRLRRRDENTSPLTLTITAPSVRRFQMDGAQKIDINAYAQDELELESNGASQINASGAARALRVQLNGAAQANLGRLVNEDAEVQLNGAGQATLATTGRADIEINGVGSVTLRHRPQSLHSERHGFGSVRIDESGGDDWEGDESAKPAPAPVPPAPAKPLPKPKGTAA